MKKTLTVLMMVLLAAMLIISCDNKAKEPEVKTYTVTFSTGEGGSDIASQSIEDGKTATKPADPTRTGYYFVRWSATENGTTAFDFSTKIAKDTTIYAVWAKEYKTGETGPAGGIIFYDCDADNTTDGGAGADGLKSSDCGWRYLEAASADLTGTYEWGNDGSFGTTENGIGTGKSNTKILAEKGADYQAANAVWGKTIDGYSDWFLPSKDELNLMYINLHQNKKGSFDSTWYWSSSEDKSSYAWTQNFDDGEQDYYPRNTGMSVRPIRAFL